MRQTHPPSLALFLVLLLVLTGPSAALSQHDHPNDRTIVFPHVPGYLTLAVDLHLHTVFSDGSVWPNIRIQEAVRDGLDAVAITDHLEYQPHREDIPHLDRNRSFEIALGEAEHHDLIVIRGSEITRSMPPGHSNAIFIQDANPLLEDDPISVFREAKRQGAFIFWNHPMWTAQRSDGVATLTDMHRQLIEEGLLHGIEVVNHHSYSVEALQIALDHDLTILGTSDIHGLIDWDYEPATGGHRPVTLVFAAEHSEEALKAALLAGRTVAWFDDQLIGREQWIVPLIESSLQVSSASYHANTEMLIVDILNISDADYVLRNLTDYTLDSHADVITVAAHQTTRLLVRSRARHESLDLRFDVLNAVTAPGEHPEVLIRVPVEH